MDNTSLMSLGGEAEALNWKSGMKEVSKDPGYLSCFLNTRSEIVVPIMHGNETVGVLDIDSDMVDPFNDNDRLFLEDICKRLGELSGRRD